MLIRVPSTLLVLSLFAGCNYSTLRGKISDLVGTQQQGMSGMAGNVAPEGYIGDLGGKWTVLSAARVTINEIRTDGRPLVEIGSGDVNNPGSVLVAIRAGE